MTVARRLPERLRGPDDGLSLRRLVPGDTEAVGRAVAESLEHLRPWMGWASLEPMPLRRRRAMLEQWEREWIQGGDVQMGIFVDGRIAGCCGLHHRIGPGGLEVGYWTHPAFVRRGIATTAARLLTDAAFRVPDIARAEIHHDKANEASAGIPRKLGYRFVGEMAVERVAPAEVGISCHWRVTRREWARKVPH
jgi:RimJ/RimL family protein N-acetyltransferase